MTPIASGTTTPTAAGLTDDSRKAKPFLGIVNVPFAEFIMGRYPSSKDEIDEEDRKTIHGVDVN